VRRKPESPARWSNCCTDAGVLTVLATLDMPAERGRATTIDRRHDASLSEAHVSNVGRTPDLTMPTKNIRYLQFRPEHVSPPDPASTAPSNRVAWTTRLGQQGECEIRSPERGQCQCCCDRGAGEADPVARAPRRSHDSAPRTPERHRSPRQRTGEKEIGDVGGSRSDQRSSRSAGAAAAPVGPSPGPARSVLARASGRPKR
jgi:hypothetical protein